MKKQIDDTVSGMTPEEEQEWMEWRESITPPDAASAEDALTRFSNELTGAEDETLTEATETLIKKVMEEK